MVKAFMCGFIFHKKFDIKKIEEIKLFKKASRLIFNRGPDNKSYFHDELHNIFHARLNIIDLNSRSDQPMSINGYNIIYNGEIYNFQELRKLLEKSFIFKTSSDTEVLLYAYLKWGKNMFERIEGMYSFVIYNLKKKKYFFARDLFGQKPLYYFKDKYEIIFSSEIKPIIKLLKLKKIEFEVKEINKYLNFNYYGDEKFTFFKNIYQVPPGNFGYIENKKLIFKKIKNIKIHKKIDDKELLILIKNEIKNCLISDVKTAILISEGVDSRSILDISKKIFKKKLKLFNLEFENYDNSLFKNSYKKNYLSNLVSTKFFKKDLIKSLDEASKICETPPLSLFTLGMIKMFKKINKKKYKVVLNGQGVDEIFGGYDIIFNPQKDNNIYHPSGDVLSKTNQHYLIKKLKNNNIKKTIKKIRTQMAFQTKIPKNLNQYDKISMNFSIENRSPYLSSKLSSLIKILSFEQIYKKEHTKYIFRKLLFKLTKNNYYFRKKIYKQAPQSEFMSDKDNFLKIKNILHKKNYCDKFFIKKNVLQYLYEFKRKKNNGFIIWQYLSLNSFLNKFKKINF
jgi:asparagine synthase (glutamine-hydrolysing)